jgi:TPR repeat protein
MVEADPKLRDVETLYRRAEDGNPTAQRDFAVCLHNGDGVPQDRAAAMVWMKKAAEGGDPWAQTQYAIHLRSTGEPENQRESVEWLKRAAEQGDHRAQYTLGGQQFLGIGTPVDLESAFVNLTMASLGGSEEAKRMLAEAAGLTSINWDAVYERVRWADLTFIMGPFLEGHLEGLTTYRQHEDSTDDTLWLGYEKETAQILFKPGSGSILNTVFGRAVSVRNVYVGRAIIGDQTLAAMTISMRDIVDSGGNPAGFKPPEPALELLVSVLAPFCARQWISWSYMSF